MLVLIPLFIVTATAMQPCEDIITLDAPDALTPHLIEALDLNGIDVQSEPTCASAMVSVDEGRSGYFSVTLTLADGRSDTRELATMAPIATWIGSRVRTTHLDTLLAPVTSAEHRLVALYPTLADLNERRRTTSIEAAIDVLPMKRADSALVRPTLGVADSKRLPRVAAFEAGGNLYVNHDAPRFNKTNRLGRASRVANYLVYPHQHCWWEPQTQTTPGRMECMVNLIVLDTATNEVYEVGPRTLKRWLSHAHPALDTSPTDRLQHLGTRERILIDLINHDPTVVGH